MKIETLILSQDYSPCFSSRDEIDDDFLLNAVRSRQEHAIDKGEEWIKNGVAVFGLEVIKVVNSGEHPDLSKAIAQLVIILMVYEIYFQNINPRIYRKCTIKLTINQNGMVGKTQEPFI